MKPPNPPRKHHYLPIFYTRRWTNADGQMTRYARVHGDRFDVRRVTPSGVGYERDLYTLPGLPSELAHQLESEFFSGLDHAAADVLTELAAGMVPANAARRSDWARFLMAFWFRAPEDLSAYKQAFAALVARDFPDLSWDEHEREQLVLNNLRQMIDSRRSGAVLINMQWDVVDVEGADHELLTSDQPVIRSNGLKPPDGNYAFPLSPTKIFIATWPSTSRTAFLRLPPNRKVRLFNEMLTRRARRFVLDRSGRQAAFVQKHFRQEPVPTPVESVLSEYLTDE